MLNAISKMRISMKIISLKDMLSALHRLDIHFQRDCRIYLDIMVNSNPWRLDSDVLLSSNQKREL